MRDRLGTTQHVGHTHVNDMESAAEQGDIRVGFMAEEFPFPEPRASGRGLGRRHEEHRFTVHFEVVTIKAEPKRAFARELQLGERVDLSV